MKHDLFVSDALCKVPVNFQGDWFSIEQGDEKSTLINEDRLTNRYFDGSCHELLIKNETRDREGRFEARVLFNDE